MPSILIDEHNVTIEVPVFGQPNFEVSLRDVFGFFRRFGNGRYSDRTLMSVQRLYDEHVDGVDENIPFIIRAFMPASFDEETETKMGGVLGMLLKFNDSDKTLVAIHPNWRRKGIGTRLVSELRRYHREFHFWLHQTNTEGQQFALAMGALPTAMNSQGALKYSVGVASEDY